MSSFFFGFSKIPNFPQHTHTHTHEHTHEHTNYYCNFYKLFVSELNDWRSRRRRRKLFKFYPIKLNYCHNWKICTRVMKNGREEAANNQCKCCFASICNKNGNKIWFYYYDYNYKTIGCIMFFLVLFSTMCNCVFVEFEEITGILEKFLLTIMILLKNSIVFEKRKCSFN